MRTRIFHNPGKHHQFADLLSRWGYAEVNLNRKGEDENTIPTLLPFQTGDEKQLGERGEGQEKSSKHPSLIQEEKVKPSKGVSEQLQALGTQLEDINKIIEFEANYVDTYDQTVSELVEESLPWIQEEEAGFVLKHLPRLEKYDYEHDPEQHPFQLPVAGFQGQKGSSTDMTSDPEKDHPQEHSGEYPIQPHSVSTQVKRGTQLSVNAMSMKRKLRFEKFAEEMGNTFKKDDISFYNPYYEGEYFTITHDVLLDFQVQDGYIEQSEINLYRDRKGRVMMKEHRLPHLIIGIHVQNNHVGVEQDLRVLRRFHIEGKTVAETSEVMVNYRQLCLHCARYPHLLRMPLNKTLIGRRPRKVLRMDYLSVNKAGHLLVIIDTFSRKTFLKHCEKEDAYSAAEGLLEWHAHYVLSEHFILITDNGSHFANELMKELVPKLRGRHEFSIPFAPWTNGSCENRNRMVLRILRQLCSELGLTAREWPAYVPIVMGVINNLPIPSRKGRTANQLFLGTTTNQSLVPYCKMESKKTMILETGEKVENLVKSLQQEWIRSHEQEQIYDHIDLAREINNKKRNAKLSVIQFRPGDWVLYSTVGRPNRINKLQPIWVGPLRIRDVLGKNVYHLEDVFGRKFVVHASRLFFYNTDKYVPEEYVQKMYRQHWTGLELDRIHGVSQDEKGYITVGVVWYGFPNDDPEWLPLENVLDGAHLLLDKFIRENKDSIEPNLYQEVNRKIQERLSSLEVNATTASESSGSPLFERGDEDDPMDSITERGEEWREFMTKKMGPKAKEETTGILVNTDKPTYLRGWTVEEVATLKDWLSLRPCGQWQQMLPLFPAKNKSQIICKVQRLLNTRDLRKYNGKVLKDYFVPSVKNIEDIRPTLNRDLRETPTFKKLKREAKEFLTHFEEALKETIERNGRVFRGKELAQVLPNYYRWGDYVYRHVPLGALWKRGRVEDIPWTEGPVDLLYMDPPWKLNCPDPTRGPLLDYGKQSLKEVKGTLELYPCRLLAIWVVNFVYLDVLRFLHEMDFTIVKQVDWIKHTERGNLAKTYGYYLQHSKESMLIASYSKRETKGRRDIPSFFRAKQVRPSGKPVEAQIFLETWFPDHTNRLELYARNNNLRPGWKSIGLELKHPGLEAVFIRTRDIPENFRTMSTRKN